MTEVRGSKIAELARTTRQAVSKADLPRTDSGLYDLDDPTIKEWIKGASRRSRKQRTQESDSADRSEQEDLERQKTEAEIDYLRERTIKEAIGNAKQRNQLVPIESVTEYAGAYASGVRTYLHPLGNRLAPRVVSAVQSGSGQDEIQQLIEDEVADAIERSLAMGNRAIDELMEQWPEDDDDGDEASAIED
jgi:hypothetical protein